ncbi:MAG: precorrin-2 C(20)-methyltransferase [Thermomicrobia bacterium]|nr:precorrin-2 C(20)-methyltransferase [Thermomicrobia bacterium]
MTLSYAISRPGLYGVGVGPGDPKWMTVRAVEILQAADVVVLPQSERSAESRVAAVVASVVDATRQRVLSLAFTTAGGRHAAEQSREAIYQAVVGELDAGKAVAFPLIGDPLTYGSFGYLLTRVHERLPSVPVEVVPAFAAAAAAIGRPLVSGGDRLAVLPAVYDGDLAMLRETLGAFETVVLLKVYRCVDAVIALLDTLGLTGGAYYAAHIGMAEEEFVRDVRILRGRDLPYLSLLVVQRTAAETRE